MLGFLAFGLFRLGFLGWTFYIRKMLNGASGALFKEAKIEI
jgi:hypothetical protein